MSCHQVTHQVTEYPGLVEAEVSVFRDEQTQFSVISLQHFIRLEKFLYFFFSFDISDQAQSRYCSLHLSPPKEQLIIERDCKTRSYQLK